ncbi:hypothetical protein [Lacticaseibacillus rhamnosus]|uniref:hypothetical protein n=1 Tax=Lacticaseibacillus rhamnosus TaxID=47715 RepID=UPI0002324A44|nr:hypothetical protein [Lacticaseibacillus rhamnosus]AER65390.1 hypothetical protein LRHK_2671 [Lacticaseibacillus rhamnosus ATCC 8530]WND15856.1 hypothetical protein RI131_12885 [Lacticaseibacillus rhamnosus]
MIKKVNKNQMAQGRRSSVILEPFLFIPIIYEPSITCCENNSETVRIAFFTVTVASGSCAMLAEVV